MISPLIPWNAGGAFVITALGLGIADGNIENLLYIPLAFACWLSPLIGLTYAALGRFSPKMSAEELDRYQREEEEMSENKTVEVRHGDSPTIRPTMGFLHWFNTRFFSMKNYIIENR